MAERAREVDVGVGVETKEAKNERDESMGSMNEQTAAKDGLLAARLEASKGKTHCCEEHDGCPPHLNPLVVPPQLPDRNSLEPQLMLLQVLHLKALVVPLQLPPLYWSLWQLVLAHAEHW